MEEVFYERNIGQIKIEKCEFYCFIVLFPSYWQEQNYYLQIVKLVINI